jgi:hypothetical protein
MIIRTLSRFKGETAAVVAILLLGAAGYLALVIMDRRAPEGAGGGKAGQAERLNREAVGMLSAGDPQGAVPLMREAVRLDPGNEVMRQNLSQGLALLSEAGGVDADERLSLLEEALGMWTGNIHALEDIAALHFGARRYRQALEAADMLARISSQDREAGAFRDMVSRRAREAEGMVFEEGRGFTLFYSGRKKLEFSGELMAILEKEVDDISLALGVRPARALDILVLTPDLGAKGDRPDSAVGAIYDGRIRLYLGEERSDPARLRATIRHELVHALLFAVSLDMPAWLQEGLAQRYGERIGDEQIVAYRNAFLQAEADEGWWVSPLTIRRSIIDLPRLDRSRAYALCLLFVDFLDRRYGRSWAPRLLAAVGEGKTLAQAGIEATGSAPAAWEQEFAREMGRE